MFRPRLKLRRTLRYRKRHTTKIPVDALSYYPTTMLLPNSTERRRPVPRLFINVIPLRAHSGALVKASGCTGASYV